MKIFVVAVNLFCLICTLTAVLLMVVFLYYLGINPYTKLVRLQLMDSNTNTATVMSPVRRSNSTTAIIVPFRDRNFQLGAFLKHMNEFLKRQQLDYKIFIIQQVQNQSFNRAKLMNIGFVEARKQYPFTCYVFHDVDLLPITDKVYYNCSKKGPVHLASAIDQFNYTMPYVKYFGGACMFTPEQFLRINGFSNMFWGWGGEDDEAYYRVVNTNQTVQRWPSSVIKYKSIKHLKDKKINKDRFILLKNAMKDKTIRNRDGLNTLRYKLISNTRLQQYVNITVDLLK